MNERQRPYSALDTGSWFKLIGGASSQNIPTLFNLALTYALAGADCVDVSADPAVILQVAEAIRMAGKLAGTDDLPLLMVSLSDGADAHFRKARFSSELCPEDCPRPCLHICPVDAIAQGGVDARKCYGCGRCEPVCPLGLIELLPWEHSAQSIGGLLAPCPVDAVEIHTHSGNLEGFERLWKGLEPLRPRLKLVAVSFPDEPGMRAHLGCLAEIILGSVHGAEASTPLVWQIDGLPMSGDLTPGTARSAVRFARAVETWNLPGYLQLAGGTNDHTVALTRASGLRVAGVGYGSYARKLVAGWTEGPSLADRPEGLKEAVRTARTLVHQLKPDLLLQQEGAPWLTTSPR